MFQRIPGGRLQEGGGARGRGCSAGSRGAAQDVQAEGIPGQL
jgi:hypothetical protein